MVGELTCVCVSISVDFILVLYYNILGQPGSVPLCVCELQREDESTMDLEVKDIVRSHCREIDNYECDMQSLKLEITELNSRLKIVEGELEEYKLKCRILTSFDYEKGEKLIKYGQR